MDSDRKAPAPEPSAQGEPVAWMTPGYPQIITDEWKQENLNVYPWVKDYTTPLYASAPSTPPPAVVEAVPLTNERGGYFSASLLASATMSDEAEGRAYRGYCPKCKHLTLVVKQRGNGLVFKGCAVCDSMVVLRDDA